KSFRLYAKKLCAFVCNASRPVCTQFWEENQMSKFTAPLLAAAVISGCATAGFAQDLTQVTIAMPGTTCLANFPIYNGIEEGYFAEEGLDVRPQALNGSASVIQAMVAGQAQFGTP